MKQVPQLIKADHLTQSHPQVKMRVREVYGDVWVLARPMSMGNILTRIKLAWLVFTGECDALKWYRQ